MVNEILKDIQRCNDVELEHIVKELSKMLHNRKERKRLSIELYGSQRAYVIRKEMEQKFQLDYNKKP